ncbi:ferredoxin [Actinocorallia herbida]|uniref:Ferredoxin n=1 Tax=Actinocorallia herbida TaxID=58109 RepID=A0A3N1D388_9ACTN|nr:ferredoxin [Actinocorallia herbida]ROO87994.1 ferredoxin [Actinocorallia herbida]
MTMKVLIDSEKCCGYGICAEICPSVFKLDAQGFVFVEGDTVSEEEAQAAIEAADACPEVVITFQQA